MEKDRKLQKIMDKLASGMHFGLFEDGTSCYFEDGTHVNYTDLWKAVKVVHNLQEGHHKTLAQLCPESFIGAYTYSFSKHKWAHKRVSNGVFSYAGNLVKSNFLAFLFRKLSF